MKIFIGSQLHEIDRATCERQQIDSVELMERAANAVTYEIISRFLPSQRIVILAGPGNNGGDALAVARLLIEQGYKRIEVFLFNIRNHLSYDNEQQKNRLITIEGVDFTEVSTQFNPPFLSADDVIVDGLFGSGLTKPMAGGFAMLARLINESGAYVISIDSPSGLFAEWNAGYNPRDMVHANLTLTFQQPRLSFMFEDNADVLGEWKVLDIDLDQQIMKETPTEYMLVEARSVRPLLHKRRPFSHKRDYGSSLIFAGSMGMMGASILAARGCLRAGSGLVTVHSAMIGCQIVQTAVPEAMFEPDRNDQFITDMSVHHKHGAIAVGPGIGTGEQTIDALEALIKGAKSPLILDADALNCIAKRPALLSLLPLNTIITPHAGEFDRLFGQHRTAEERLKKAVEMAKYYNIIIVLKGHHTAVIRPTGRVYFNSTGNPGMATAGSGDVLTGVICGFLAQGFRPEHAATLGVYIHGLAGDIAAEELGEYGMNSGDIADRIGRAIFRIINPE